MERYICSVLFIILYISFTPSRIISASFSFVPKLMRSMELRIFLPYKQQSFLIKLIQKVPSIKHLFTIFTYVSASVSKIFLTIIHTWYSNNIRNFLPFHFFKDFFDPSITCKLYLLIKFPKIFSLNR